MTTAPALSDPQDYRPSQPWLGAHWQTIRNTIFGNPTDLSRWPGKRLEFATLDNSGDKLTAVLHHPETGPGPLVLLIHGLTGDEDSTYMRRSAAELLRAGYSALRLNLRGAGIGRKLARQHYHSGRTEDLRAVIAGLPDDLKSRGMAGMGVSLGANMLLKYMGEEGASAPLATAISVSAPIDLGVTAKRFLALGNKPYHQYLITRMKAESLAAPGLDEELACTIRAIRTTFEFDDRLTGPLNGWSGAVEYYQINQAQHWLRGIGKPVLAMHALDDPWIPGFLYERVDWAKLPCVTPHLTRRGGHVGFHSPGGGQTTWHDRQALAFLAYHLPV